MQSVGTMALQPHLSSASPSLSFFNNAITVSLIHVRPSLAEYALAPITQCTVQDYRGRPEI